MANFAHSMGCHSHFFYPHPSALFYNLKSSSRELNKSEAFIEGNFAPLLACHRPIWGICFVMDAILSNLRTTINIAEFQDKRKENGAQPNGMSNLQQN